MNNFSLINLIVRWCVSIIVGLFSLINLANIEPVTVWLAVAFLILAVLIMPPVARRFDILGKIWENAYLVASLSIAFYFLPILIWALFKNLPYGLFSFLDVLGFIALIFTIPAALIKAIGSRRWGISLVFALLSLVLVVLVFWGVIVFTKGF